MKKIFLVIPAFQESARLPLLLNQIGLDEKNVSEYLLDIVVADDGSRASESQKMATQVQTAGGKLSEESNVTLSFHRFTKNQGKGAVIRNRFEQAIAEKKYEAVGFLDADGATPFPEWRRLAEHLLADSKLGAVLGSRWQAMGHPVERTWRRHASGRIFATLVALLFSFPVYDSQCGAKIFRVQPALLGFIQRCYDRRWLFDTQLLILLWKHGIPMVEDPVTWADQPGSKVSLWKDSVRMFVGLWKFRSHV